MLKSLSAENFQKNRSRKIEFDPLATVLVGKSDSGKSSFLRLLRWVMLNHPSGDAFITWGEEVAQGTLVFDSHTVTRTRSKKGHNTYQLDEQQPFKAFGDTVPEPIAALLNVGEDINFAGQLDAPFWFLRSPGQVSKDLNKIVDLSLIDSTLGSLSTTLRKARYTVQVSRERLDSAKQRRQDLLWVVDAYEDWQVVKQLNEQIMAKRKQLQYSQTVVQRFEEIKKKIAVAERIMNGMVIDAGTLKLLSDEINEKRQRVRRIKALLKDLERCRKTKERTKTEFTKLQEELKRRLGDRCPLCGEVKKKDKC